MKNVSKSLNEFYHFFSLLRFQDLVLSRPILTYGWEFLETSEKTIKTMRTDECKCLKRILGVQKTAKNSSVYNALEITEPLNQIYVIFSEGKIFRKIRKKWIDKKSA